MKLTKSRAIIIADAQGHFNCDGCARASAAGTVFAGATTAIAALRGNVAHVVATRRGSA